MATKGEEWRRRALCVGNENKAVSGRERACLWRARGVRGSFTSKCNTFSFVVGKIIFQTKYLLEMNEKKNLSFKKSSFFLSLRHRHRPTVEFARDVIRDCLHPFIKLE